jgi:hypothetical protein
MAPLRIATFLVVVPLLLSAVGGGYPVKLSPECRSAISACLAGCDGQSSASAPAMTPNSGGNAVFPSDHRSDCESACQSSCDH